MDRAQQSAERTATAGRRVTPEQRREAIWGCLRVEDQLTDDEIELLYRAVQLPALSTAQRHAVEQILHRLGQGALAYG